VGPREGFQIEDSSIPTGAKVALVDELSRTGLRSIELVAFVSPKWVPQMADAEEVLSGITRVPGVRYTAIYLNAQGLQRALAADCAVDGSISVSASDAFSRRNTNKGIEDTVAAIPGWIDTYQAAGIPVETILISAAFGCNFEGFIPLGRVFDLIARLRAIAAERGETIRRIKLLDTMGWANPEQIRRTIDAVRAAHPDVEIALHLHDTRGLGLANAHAALSEGIREFDSAVGGLGGCPFGKVKGAAGNIATEDFVFLCQELGIETGVDLEALLACVEHAEQIVGHPLPGHLAKGGVYRELRPTGWAAATSEAIA
jgi:hydroxymethylglutaryl-CoA lyase